MKSKKNDRRIAIKETIKLNLLITDYELCEKFDISVQTIRSDRTHLSIPELRKRTKLVAGQNYGRTKSIKANGIIGDLVRMNSDTSAQSLVEIIIDPVFTKNEIARGHALFAQANSLYVALIHKPIVLTHENQVEFKGKVKLSDAVRADTRAIDTIDKYYIVEVNSYVSDMLVLRGRFRMYYTSEDE